MKQHFFVGVKCCISSECMHRYDGEWVEGLKKGKGKFIYGNGDAFEGNYDNNERHGEGFLVKVEGEKRQEQWKLGKLVNFQVVS